MYAVPYKRRLTYKDIKQLANAIKRPPRAWTADLLWDAYATVETSRVHRGGRRIATDLVSLVRFALEQENELVPYRESVEQRFQSWLIAQRNQGRTFTPAQMEWLERIRDTVAGSLAVSSTTSR
jgi:type I restriction enzyme R subunit